MLEALNGSVSIQGLIWLFPVIFMLHDFEEIIFVEGWFRKNYPILTERIPASFRPLLAKFSSMTGTQFAVAVLTEFIVFIPVTFAAAEHGFLYMFLAFNSILFLHVFTHAGQALFLRMYTPGVVTAVLITLPYAAYLFYRLLREGLISWNLLLSSIPAGLIVIPIVLLGHELGRRIAPSS